MMALGLKVQVRRTISLRLAWSPFDSKVVADRRPLEKERVHRLVRLESGLWIEASFKGT